MLDKATLTLGDNRRVDLSQTVIFMTSNPRRQRNHRPQWAVGYGSSNPTTSLRPTLDQKVERTAVGSRSPQVFLLSS